MTDAECAKLVAVMMGAFPSAKFNAQTSQVYERMLRDLDYRAANAAVERLLATSRFMPTVADVREAALALTSGEIKPGGEAWGEVLRLISRYGARRYDVGWEPPIADPATRQTVAALGWVNLCDSENQVADRARFVELYDKLAASQRRSQLSEHLPATQRLREAQVAQRLEQRSGAASAGGAIMRVLSATVDTDGKP